MGPYPFFTCRDWKELGKDLEGLTTRLVSLVFVADPFGPQQVDQLRSWFDLVKPFKTHFVTDLRQDPEAFLPRSHRRNLSRALQSVRVERCAELQPFLQEWHDLYGQLAGRYQVTGVRAFSREVFTKQFQVPGLVMFRATSDLNDVVGLHLWYVHDNVAYGHLGATNAKGRELMASYALYSAALEYFRSRVEWLNLGAVAGLDDTLNDGLRRFKAGWSTGSRPAFLCGRIFNRERYDALTRAAGSCGSTYFPAYRAGEFASTQLGAEGRG